MPTLPRGAWEVSRLIRGSGVDCLLNLTCGMGGDFIPDTNDPSIHLPGTDLVGVRAAETGLGSGSRDTAPSVFRAF